MWDTYYKLYLIKIISPIGLAGLIERFELRNALSVIPAEAGIQIKRELLDPVSSTG